MSVGPFGPGGVLQNFERSLFWDPLSAKAKESKKSYSTESVEKRSQTNLFEEISEVWGGGRIVQT